MVEIDQIAIAYIFVIILSRVIRHSESVLIKIIIMTENS